MSDVKKVREALRAAEQRARDEAPTLPDAVATATHYKVSVLPEEHFEHRLWTLAVEYRGRHRWAVTDGDFCLSADGNWSYESIPSERVDEWTKAHRFDLDTALDLARKHARLMTVNGRTVADALEAAERQRENRATGPRN